jgi:hypothetical protein
MSVYSKSSGIGEGAFARLGSEPFRRNGSLFKSERNADGRQLYEMTTTQTSDWIEIG